MFSFRFVAQLLVGAGYLVSTSPTSHYHPSKFESSVQHLGKRAEVCHFDQFFCPLDNTNVFEPNYDSLQFLPSGSTGNPISTKFCLGSTCNPAGTVSITIQGDSCASISPTDPSVIITFSLSGYIFDEEHVWVGQNTGSIPNGPGNYPFTTGKGQCTGNTDGTATCTIPLATFLSVAGIKSICPDSSPQQFYIVTHASLHEKTTGNQASGTSDGTCLNSGCNPWFAYKSIGYQCTQCTPCTTCTCPAYATGHFCECTPDCTCPDYAAANKCQCNPDCSCPDYAAAHFCECSPDCTCPDYAAAHFCECTPDCTCPDYAAAHFCECTPDCTCPDYAAAHFCECTPDCTCPDYAATHKCECNPDCSCPDYATANKCKCNPDCSCPDYATANKCKCNPDCSCPNYAAAHPTQCFKWCDIGTAFGWVPPQSRPPSPITFTSLGIKTCNRWGWYYAVSPSDLRAGIDGLLEVGAGGNDVTKATEVGAFTAQLSGTTFTFTYSLDASFDLSEMHVQASCKKPMTCAPGQYTYGGSASQLSGFDDQTFTGTFGVPSCSTYYLIFHATANERFPLSANCPNAAQ